jgi:hypothetical protein
MKSSKNMESIMAELRKKDDQLDFYNRKLKESDRENWVEFITAIVLELMQLNLQNLPDPGIIVKMSERLYGLLKTRWPGVTKDQFYRTLHHGYTKQGSYGNFRVTYPLLANWVLYHQQMNKPTTEKEPTPALHEQAKDIMTGLAEYRKRVEAGEYKPEGRGGKSP